VTRDHNAVLGWSVTNNSMAIGWIGKESKETTFEDCIEIQKGSTLKLM